MGEQTDKEKHMDKSQGEQKILLQIVETWRPSEFPEYRGFRCANCQQYKNEAWYHWVNTGDESGNYRLPIHMCNDTCEPQFQKGTIQIDESKHATVDRKNFGNSFEYTNEAKNRFREIVSGWPDYKEPELKAYSCDDCGNELDIDSSDGRRKGYHVWWKMDDGETLAELHFHKDCGHNLGIYTKEELQQKEQKENLTFKEFILPTGEATYIPADIDLKLPDNSLPLNEQHFLLEIPWDDRFLDRVPKEYLEFFKFVLPHLAARTTDVHTASSMEFLHEAFGIHPKVDKTVVAAALNLHDNGWFLMSQEEIAASLGVRGLTLTDKAMGPKEKHAVLGSDKARELLEQYAFNPKLTQSQKNLIIKAVLYHDKPWELAGKSIPLEMQLICDLDHLWSFTHENFWQDTVRKGVNPKEYLENLRNDLNGYFISNWGKEKARSLLSERESEVEKYQTFTLNN